MNLKVWQILNTAHLERGEYFSKEKRVMLNLQDRVYRRFTHQDHSLQQITQSNLRAIS